MSNNPLGKNTTYPDQYDAGLLFPIPRDLNREKLGFADEALPFRGFDVWRAYELSWLNEQGKPVTAVGEFIVPVDSPNIIESKSLKLYLNSLNQTQFSDIDSIQSLIAADLGAVAGTHVLTQLSTTKEDNGFQLSAPAGFCLDDIDITIDTYQPDANLLHCAEHNQLVTETLHSNLFRSNCPVTSQPDWGTVVLSYSGSAINHSDLLRYLVSYRHHEGFHEDCAEQIFRDVMQRCSPKTLSVAINFLRRGGVEINPVRTNSPNELEFSANRFPRQ